MMVRRSKKGRNPLDPKDDQKCDESKKAMGLWLNPKSSSDEKDMTFLGQVVPFKGGFSAKENYDHRSDSAHPKIGPQPRDLEFFAYLYEGKDGLSFFFHQGKDESTYAKTQALDVKVNVIGNGSADKILVSDDPDEFKPSSTGKGNSYTGAFRYRWNSDGGVVGPLTTRGFKVLFQPVSFTEINKMSFVSGDGKTHNLKVSSKFASFAVGYIDDPNCHE
jgi:hypothetical protein